ncbi:MAG: MATE family efflux transporter, partial [Ruminococcaceae bacterium]|nr:MATE family efflux transporter [Oscillospiraceae bacterium]
GAGLATFISNCAALLYFIVLLIVKGERTYVCIDPRRFSFDRRVAGGIFGVGIPASIQNLLNVTGMTILNNFTAGFGADAVAAMGVAQKIYQIPFSLALGISQGVMPLISYNYAAKNPRRMKDGLLFTTKISLSVMAVISVCYFLLSEPLVALFMKNDAVVALGSVFLRCFAVGQVFIVMDFIAVGVFQACGIGKLALLFAILRKVVLEIPLLFILNALVPLYGLACAQTVTEIVLAAAAILVLIRLFRKISRECGDA